MLSSLHHIRRTMRQLEDAGIRCALGGSALLYSLSLAAQVRDWDLTTDAPLEAAVRALEQAGLAWEAEPSGDYPFASSYRLSLRAGEADGALPVDLIGGFSIHSDTGLCRLPSSPAFEWEGLPMAAPETWAAAYALMGRQAKAELLFAYLRRHGAHAERMRSLLAEPLPASIRAELERIPAANAKPSM